MAIGQFNLDLAFPRRRPINNQGRVSRHLYRQKRRRLIRRLETRIAQPFENQIGVHIIAARYLRYRNTRHARLTDDPTLLIVTP